MKHFFNLSVVLIVSTLNVYPSGFPPDFFDKLAAPFSNLSLIEYNSESRLIFNSTQFSEKFVESYAFPQGGIKAKIGLKYFYYDIDYFYSKAPNTKSAIVALNGNGYQNFAKNSSVLSVTEYPPKAFDFMYNNEDLFLPYLFTQFERINNITFCLSTISDLSLKVRWEKLKENLKFIDSTAEYFVGKIEVGPDLRTNLKLSYLIKFSKKNAYFPMQWEQVDDSNKVLFSYKTLDLGQINVNGVKFYYPKLSEYKSYGGLGDIPLSTEARTTKRIEVKSIVINGSSLSNDDGFFEIDPSIAKYVYDIDRRLRIKVPN